MRQNMAETTLGIIKGTKPTITPAANPDFNIRDWVKDYQDGVNWRQAQEDRQQRQGFINEYNAAVDSGDTQAQQKSLAKLAPELAARLQAQQDQWQQNNIWEREKLQKVQDFQERLAYLQNALKGEEKRQKQEKAEQEEANQLQSAQIALNDLMGLADTGNLSQIGKYLASRGYKSGARQRAEGRRDAALSSLLPLTNSVARDSGGSGINTLGEMMAYLGMPEDATDEQIKGALPMIAQKLGLKNPYDSGGGKSLIGFNPKAQSQNHNVGGFTIERVE